LLSFRIDTAKARDPRAPKEAAMSSHKTRPIRRTHLLSTLLVLSAAASAACSHTLPPYVAQPSPPGAYAPAGPDGRARAVPVELPAPPESIVPVALTLDLRSVQEAVRAALPERFDSAKHPLGVDYQWEFVRDGEPQVQIRDGRLSVHAVYRGAVETAGARGCKLDPLYPVIEAGGPLALKERGSDLAIELPTPQVTIDLKPESDARCNMFNTPVKEQLAELLNRDALAQRLSGAVQGRYRIPLHDVWARLAGPTAVAVQTLQTRACIYGSPSELYLSPLRGPAEQSVLNLAAKASTLAVLEPTCRTAPTPPMRATASAPAEAVAPGPFRMLGRIPIPYATLTRALQDRLYHQEVVVGEMLADKLLIEEISAADSSGRTLITVRTSGDLNGRIYYWATPRFDADGTHVKLDDLQMDSESRRQLDAVREGYWRKIDPGLKALIRSSGIVDLTEPIAQLRRAVSQPHPADDLSINWRVTRQQPERVVSTGNGLVADILLEGTAQGDGRVSVDGGRIEPGGSARAM
jgi:hypothetical protein